MLISNRLGLPAAFLLTAVICLPMLVGGQTRSIVGNYSATGTNPDGGTYAASLSVLQRGEVYQFAWDSAGTKYGGVGVIQGSSVAVAYTEGLDGSGCGVVLYRIQADGSLDGKAGYFGQNNDEVERAVKTSGSGFEGSYRVSGSTPKGERYSGTLEIGRNGAGYDFSWNTGNTLRGFGILRGQHAAVGFGGSQCAFVYYRILTDGTLDGEWGGPGSRTLGTEVARRRR